PGGPSEAELDLPTHGLGTQLFDDTMDCPVVIGDDDDRQLGSGHASPFVTYRREAARTSPSPHSSAGYSARRTAAPAYVRTTRLPNVAFGLQPAHGDRWRD